MNIRKPYYELQYRKKELGVVHFGYFTNKKELHKFIRNLPKVLAHFRIIHYKRNFSYNLNLSNDYIKVVIPQKVILK